VSTREKAAQNARRRQLRGAGSKQRGGARLDFDFCIIYRIATAFNLQITHNYSKNMKISKNESCSTFQTLQLCFKEHFQILPPF